MHCSFLLRADIPGPAASSSGHCDFPSGMDCVLNKPFLPVRLCYHSTRKINQDSGHRAHELGGCLTVLSETQLFLFSEFSIR